MIRLLLALAVILVLFVSAADAAAPACKGPVCPAPKIRTELTERVVVTLPAMAAVTVPTVDRAAARAVAVAKAANDNRPHLVRRALAHVRCRPRCGG